MSRKYNIVGIIVANVEPKKEESREKDTNCACLFVPQLCTIDAPRPKIPIKKRSDFLTLRLNKGCHTRRFTLKATRMTSQGRIVTAGEGGLLFARFVSSFAIS